MVERPIKAKSNSYPYGLARLDPRTVWFLTILRRALMMICAALETIIDSEK